MLIFNYRTTDNGYFESIGSEIHRNIHILETLKVRIEQLQLCIERAALRVSANCSQALNDLLCRRIQVGILDFLEVPFVQLHYESICPRKLMCGQLKREFANSFENLRDIEHSHFYEIIRIHNYAHYSPPTPSPLTPHPGPLPEGEGVFALTPALSQRERECLIPTPAFSRREREGFTSANSDNNISGVRCCFH